MTNQQIAKWLKVQKARASKLEKHESFYSTGMWVFLGVGILGHFIGAAVIEGIGIIGFLAAGSLMVFCGVLSMAIRFYSIRKAAKLLKQNRR